MVFLKNIFLCKFRHAIFNSAFGHTNLFALGTDQLYLCDQIKNQLTPFNSPKTLITMPKFKIIGRDVIHDILTSCGADLNCNKFTFSLSIQRSPPLPPPLSYDEILNQKVENICSKSLIAFGTPAQLLHIKYMRSEVTAPSKKSVPNLEVRTFNISEASNEVNKLNILSPRYKHRPCDVYAVTYTQTKNLALGEKLKVFGILLLRFRCSKPKFPV